MVLIAGITGQSAAQTSSNKGTEFWVGFMAHSSSSAGMYLYITSDSSTTGTVSIPGKNWSTTFSVTANNMTLVTVPTNLAYVDCSDCVRDQGIKVTSEKKVIVYSHIYYQYRSDATLVLPTTTTGKEYYCMSYKQGISSDRSQFMIIGQKDSTRIRITPTVNLRSASNGTLNADKSYYITLNEGQVYQGRAYSGNSADDVTGTYIEVIDTGATSNCRTVSVFSGNSWTSLGCTGGFNSGDNLYEQMYPVNSWGSQFVTVPLKTVNSDNLRFLAAKDKTTIIIKNLNGSTKIMYLNAGEYEDLVNVDEPKYVIASGPIMVAQFAKTQACAGSQSDPSMTIINPIEQTLTNITLYSSRYEAINSHFINVVIPTSAVSSFRVDGKTTSFTTLSSNSRYSYAQITVNQGNHQLSAAEGFVALAYGFGQYESYGYAAGANVKDLTAKIKLTNSSLNEEMNICLGQAAELEGTAEYQVARWEWHFGDGLTDTVQNPKHIYKDTGHYLVKLYTYKYTYDGCSNFDSAFLKVRVTGRPVARFVSQNRCELGEVQYVDSSIAPPDELINLRMWKFHTGSTVYLKNPKKYYDTSGMYPVRYIVRTEYFCYDTIMDSIYISPLPDVGFTADRACQFDSIDFVNTSTVREGKIASYSWAFGDGDSSIKKDPSHFYQDSGQYIVTLSATTDSACSWSYNDTVYKYPVVDLAFDFNDTCQDIRIDFVNKTNPSGANITAMGWINSAGDTSDNYNYNYTFDTDGNYLVRLWVEIDSFCKDHLEKSVEIYPLVKTGFKHSDLCVNKTVEFINTSTISSGGINIQSWLLGDGKTYYNDTNAITYSSPGVKNISLKTVSDKGCLSKLDTQLTLKEIEITSLKFSDVCAGSVQTILPVYTLNYDTIDTWEWDVNSTLVSTTDNLTTGFSPAGKYEIKLTVNTTGGCTAALIDSIVIFENPVAQFTVGPVCDRSDFTIDNTSFISPPYTITNYYWLYNNALASTSQLPVIKSDINVLTGIGLVVKSDKGCYDTLVRNTAVYPLPQVDFYYIDSCLGQTTTLKDKSVVPGGSISSSDWKFHDGTNANGLQVSKVYGGSMAFLLKHLVTTNRGCVDSIQKAVTIHPLPVVDISADEYYGCKPFTPDFKNNSDIFTGSIVRYDWNVGDGSKISIDDPTHTYLNPGVYKVKVTATTDKGCVDSGSLPMDITVYDLPFAQFEFLPEKPSILESTLTFKDLSSSDVTSWLWQFGDGFTSNDQHPEHLYEDTGQFVIILTVTNDNGCSNSTSQSFFLNPELFIYIPTSFTPNGDLINDNFGVTGVTNGIKNYQVNIYNRWGQKIYHSEDASVPWDGTYEGKPVPAGSYLFEMRFSDYKVTRWYFKNGEVLLLR